MDDSANVPLEVPGFGGIPLDYQLSCEERFCHGFNEWCQTPAITACELSMIDIMNQFTDMPGWYDAIWVTSTVVHWREKAFSQYPRLGDKAWEWCVRELRDKAAAFREKGYVRVLDTGSCVCKSDTMLDDGFIRSLKSSIDHLCHGQTTNSKLPPKKQISNNVDPLMYPLVYGKSRCLRHGVVVDINDMFASMSKTEQVPKHMDRRTDSDKVQDIISQGQASRWYLGQHRFETNVENYYWSSNFQSLPCEVKFREEKANGVEITSYINNLHPENISLYRNIEHLISQVIQPWNECLIKGQQEFTKENGSQNSDDQMQRGPVSLRIVTFGVKWMNDLPRWALSLDKETMDDCQRYREAEQAVRTIPPHVKGKMREVRLKALSTVRRSPWLKGLKPIPEPTAETWRLAKEYLQLPKPGSAGLVELPKGWEASVWDLIEAKVRQLRFADPPQPGTTFSYEDWIEGRNVDKAIVNMISAPHFVNSTPRCKGPTHERNTVRLQENFRERGLQVIVKITTIELTPENPTYQGGIWSLEGNMNEHIVAMAVFTDDVSNITPCRIAFRQETPMCSSKYRYQALKGIHCKLDDPNEHHINTTQEFELFDLAKLYGFDWKDLYHEAVGNALPYQTLGHVEARQGRLIAFPNAMEHRIEPFELADCTRGGHHRYITLCLVDPNYRICSTQNVPPQQPEWWARDVKPILMHKGLPIEIVDNIMDMCDTRTDKCESDREQMICELGWSTMARRCRMKPYNF